MARYHIRIDETIPVELHRAFAELADHNNFGKIMNYPVKRIKDGHPDMNGLGCVRRVGPPIPMIRSEEKVTAFELNRFIQYKLTKGAGPMTQHLAEMHFEAVSGGTRLRWHIDYSMPPVIGWVVKTALTSVLVRGLRRMR